MSDVPLADVGWGFFRLPGERKRLREARRRARELVAFAEELDAGGRATPSGTAPAGTEARDIGSVSRVISPPGDSGISVASPDSVQSVETADGSYLGQVRQVYADVDTGSVAWVAVGEESEDNAVLIPMSDLDFDRDNIVVPFNADVVSSAPHVDLALPLISGWIEAKTYEHYGFRPRDVMAPAIRVDVSTMIAERNATLALNEWAKFASQRQDSEAGQTAVSSTPSAGQWADLFAGGLSTVRRGGYDKSQVDELVALLLAERDSAKLALESERRRLALREEALNALSRQAGVQD